MLGTLAASSAAGATRRVDPAAATERAAGLSDAAGPPRRDAPETVVPEAVATALAALSRGRVESRAFFAALVDDESAAHGRDEGDVDAPASSPAAPPPAWPLDSALDSPPASPPAAPAASPPAGAAVSAEAVGAGDAAATDGALPASRYEGAAGIAASRSADPLQAGLSEEQLAAVAALAQRDREVREHEMAHVVAGRPWAGPAVYVYQTGPDGRRYAIGGFSPIDVAPIEGDPEATAEKMRIVIAGAMAAQPPSGADRHVAAVAQARLQAALAAISDASRLARAGDEAGAEQARERISTRI